ncbi:hypothetical protein H109_00328 [Trichophyton interdigitale MR816]|uniref:DUF2293 domain-containing protein n=1 Tax=Trichophyton interdigitale (strain MR816) TaxID=1215338 RepID=A0A059JJP6_TRIIM|nr:hypothetical protein H109_00328 [Trichophyton interdigitale MR816]
MGKPQRQQRQSRAKRGAGGIRKGASKRAKDMPKALKDKLRDIAYSKTAHGFVPEDILLDNQPQPPGYVFVPKGNVYITRKCRSQTHDLGSPVFTVYCSTTYKQTGLYVPASVQAAVELESKETSEDRKRAVAQKDARDRQKARELLLKEFPNMPRTDLTAVLNHAFLKGSRRVGRSGKVASEKDKVRLAVEAHIRHAHTEYDDMIRRGLTRERARENIWDEVVILRDSWRK